MRILPVGTKSISFINEWWEVFNWRKFNWIDFDIFQLQFEWDKAIGDFNFTFIFLGFGFFFQWLITEGKELKLIKKRAEDITLGKVKPKKVS